MPYRREEVSARIYEMRGIRNEKWLILSLVIAGTGIRLIPNVTYWIWGNDFGIYYYLSRSYLNIRSWINPPASPWGIDGYQYFPVTYVMVDLVSSLTGLPVLSSLKYSIPIMGGLTPLLLYLISRELQISRPVSFLSGLLLAVDPIQTFQTSQANYLTAGHFFLLLSILFFLRYHSRFAYFVPAVLSSILLTLSHQLSSYIFLISLIGMMVSVQAYSGAWRRYLGIDIAYTVFTGTFLLGYLILRVPTSRIFLVSAASGLGLLWIILLFYAIVSSTYFLLKREGSCCILWNLTKGFRRYGKKMKNFRDLEFTGIAFMVIEISLIAIVHSGIYKFITYDSVILSIPFAIFLGISVVGTKNSIIRGERPAILGWATAIIVSMTYSALTSNTTLEVSRQVEYLVEPFSVLAGFTLYTWLQAAYSAEHPGHPLFSRSDITRLAGKLGRGGLVKGSVRGRNYGVSLSIKDSGVYSPKESGWAAVITLVSFLLVSLAITSYSMPSLFVPSVNEGATLQDEAAVAYLNSHGNRDLSVATDHQLGIMLYSYGFVCPFDKISLLWSSGDWEKAYWELKGENGSYPMVGYVLIDSGMLDNGVWGFNGVNNPSQPPIRMNSSSFSKFFREPFRLVFKDTSRSGTFTAYVFEVNLTYVNSFHSPGNTTTFLIHNRSFVSPRNSLSSFDISQFVESLPMVASSKASFSTNVVASFHT